MIYPEIIEEREIIGQKDQVRQTDGFLGKTNWHRNGTTDQWLDMVYYIHREITLQEMLQKKDPET